MDFYTYWTLCFAFGARWRFGIKWMSVCFKRLKLAIRSLQLPICKYI